MTDTPRDARKKLLLLEGALHRLEFMQARASLLGPGARSALGRGLPGVLAFLLRHRAGALLAGALPLLVGGSRLSRIVRHGALLLGAGAALMGVFNRGRRANPAEKSPASSEGAAADDKSADEKIPARAGIDLAPQARCEGPSLTSTLLPSAAEQPAP